MERHEANSVMGLGSVIHVSTHRELWVTIIKLCLDPCKVP